MFLVLGVREIEIPIEALYLALCFDFLVSFLRERDKREELRVVKTFYMCVCVCVCVCVYKKERYGKKKRIREDKSWGNEKKRNSKIMWFFFLPNFESNSCENLTFVSFDLFLLISIFSSWFPFSSKVSITKRLTNDFTKLLTTDYTCPTSSQFPFITYTLYFSLPYPLLFPIAATTPNPPLHKPSIPSENKRRI